MQGTEARSSACCSHVSTYYCMRGEAELSCMSSHALQLNAVQSVSVSFPGLISCICTVSLMTHACCKLCPVMFQAPHMRSGDSLTSSMLSDTDYAEAVSFFGLLQQVPCLYRVSPSLLAVAACRVCLSCCSVRQCLSAVGICRFFWHAGVLGACTSLPLLHSTLCAAS